MVGGIVHSPTPQNVKKVVSVEVRAKRKAILSNRRNCGISSSSSNPNCSTLDINTQALHTPATILRKSFSIPAKSSSKNQSQQVINSSAKKPLAKARQPLSNDENSPIIGNVYGFLFCFLEWL